MRYSTKKYFSFFLLLLIFPTAQAKKKDKDALAVVLQAAQKERVFRSATLCCYAVNLTKNKAIGGINVDRSIMPASTLKLLTTATALEILGKEFRFETTIQYDGEIDEEGTLHGNIYIKGGGDPTLGSNNFQEYYYRPHFVTNWVQAIQGKGIKKVTGAVVGDSQIYTDSTVPNSWEVGDLGEYYGAVASGLSIFDNIYSISLQATRENEGVSIVEIAPSLPDEVQVISQVKGAAIDKKHVGVSGVPDYPVRIIQGEIPCDSQLINVQGTSPDPTYWAACTLHQALQGQETEIAQLPTTICRSKIYSTDRRSLYTTLSPPLREIIAILNHDSVNSYAEHLVKHLSLAIAGLGDTGEGTKVLKQFWSEKDVDITGMLIRDGSGLSRQNAITPRQIVEVLRYMKKTSDNAEVFYKSLPIAGESGNMAPVFNTPPLKGNLIVKSGGMSGVRGFAGYCTNQSGDEIAFAIIANHYDGPRSSAEEAIERILEVLVQ